MKRVLKFILISKKGHKPPKMLEHKSSDIYIHACTQESYQFHLQCGLWFTHAGGVMIDLLMLE